MQAHLPGGLKGRFVRPGEEETKPLPSTRCSTSSDLNAPAQLTAGASQRLGPTARGTQQTTRYQHSESEVSSSQFWVRQLETAEGSFSQRVVGRRGLCFSGMMEDTSSQGPSQSSCSSSNSSGAILVIEHHVHAQQGFQNLRDSCC